MNTPTIDFICYRNDGASGLYRAEVVLPADSDGETIHTIARDLYDGQDDGDTVKVFRLDRENPASTADVTTDVVFEMESIHYLERDGHDADAWVHPLIAAYVEALYHDDNRAEGMARDPRTGRRYAA